jgi:hypothetical protein
MLKGELEIEIFFLVPVIDSPIVGLLSPIVVPSQWSDNQIVR